MLETAYCVCTAEKTKTKVQLSGKFAHNLRLHDVKNADPERRGLNEVLIGDENMMDIFQIPVEEAAERHKNKELKSYIDKTEETKWMVENATGRKVRKDAVLAIELVLTYSSVADDGMDIDEWKKANVNWVKSYFGEENVMNMVFHGDESQKHIHVMVSPIDRESGEPRFNAKKWLGGKAALSQMQNSYAEAMKPLGLQRGEQNSRASHQDLQTFYRALNNVVRQKLPRHEQFPNDQAYQMEVDKIYQETVIRMFALEQAIKRLESVDKTRESNQSIYREMAERQIQDYEEKIEILQSNLSEHEKKAKVVDSMQTAIRDIAKDDPDRANKIRENLNELARKGGALEKALAKKRAAMVSEEEKDITDRF